MRKLVAGTVIFTFAFINIWSVKGTGKIEDIIVYSKLVILAVILFALINNSQTTLPVLLQNNKDTSILSILIVASITFVAYEGFQLVINAVNEMENPEKNIPKAIYSALFLAVLIYVVISLGAILATSSAISGTVFGASRQIAVIAHDGYFPEILAQRINTIPVYAIISMALLAFLLVLSGNLELILEFGSITFLLVSLLMAYANYTIRDVTNSSPVITIISFIGLLFGTILIFYYEFSNQPRQMFFIAGLYALLTLSSWLYSRDKNHQSAN